MTSQEIARKCIRGLALAPGRRVRLAIPDGELREQIVSLATSAGAEVVDERAESVMACVNSLNAFLIPKELMDALSAADPGASVVIVVAHGPAQEAAQAFHDQQALRLGLERCRMDMEGGTTLLFGGRRARIKPATLKRLRSIGHSMSSSVLVGRAGLTEAVVDAVRDAVERHGIVKVKLTPQASIDKHEAALALAWATGSELVQRVGKTALLYRPDVKLLPPVGKHKRR